MSSTQTKQGLDDEVKERVCVAAARRGYSLEEGARQILAQALRVDRSAVGFATTIRSELRDAHIDELGIPPRANNRPRDPFADWAPDEAAR
jgi:plasmid stability protein